MRTSNLDRDGAQLLEVNLQHSCPLTVEPWGPYREWGPVLRGRPSLAPATPLVS